MKYNQPTDHLHRQLLGCPCGTMQPGRGSPITPYCDACRDAIGRLLEIHGGLVHSAVKAWRGRDKSGLLSTALFVFARCCKKFDPARGLKFSTYALGSIKLAFTTDRNNAGAAIRDAEELLPDKWQPAIVKDDHEPDQRVRDLQEAMELLPEREQCVLRLRLMGETLGTVGERFGITKERIRQIETTAIRRLKIMLAA